MCTQLVEGWGDGRVSRGREVRERGRECVCVREILYRYERLRGGERDEREREGGGGGEMREREREREREWLVHTVVMHLHAV